MLGSVTRRKSNVLFALTAFVSSVFALATLSSVVAHAQASTSVQAVICTTGSTIAISEPSSDSIVTDPIVTVKGSVDQASQIEVSIDGQYNDVIPLTMGQSTFETTVQLSAGTHTISLKAIDSCSVSNGEASSVVTFSLPPTSSSSGVAAETGIKDEAPSSGVSISDATGETIERTDEQQSSIIPRSVVEAWEGVMNWLNIATGDVSVEEAPRLSVIRAVTIAAGTYMATIGVATTVVNLAASSPVFNFAGNGRQFAYASRAFRVLGIVLIIGGLFL